MTGPAQTAGAARPTEQPASGLNPEGTPDDVRLESVSKQFGEVWALRPTSLTIRRGEFFSLLGASGSGKTTTLRIIAGFEQPTTGSVMLRDRDVTWSAPYERNVNTVFQDYALFPHMSVADNIGYGLRVRRVKRDAVRRRVEEALKLVRLRGFERRRPSQLSGGQRQRVALARALVNAPAVLLLDEPLGALDLKLRREMQIELKRIQTEVGITFLYVTHDQEEAMSMSDRVAVMSDGQIRQIGTPTDVYERPVDAFVAGFVGVSNVLEGRLRHRQGLHLEVDVRGIERLLIPATPEAEEGRRVIVTVRPEKLRMHTTPDTIDAPNRARGRIVDVSYGGAFTRYSVSIGGRDLAVVEQNVHAGPSSRMGEEVWLTWSVDGTHVLSGTEDDLRKGHEEARVAEGH
ncbi:MAG TPA: ABC transporter ATP-binding protein [Chloroflexota bacterium]